MSENLTPGEFIEEIDGEEVVEIASDLIQYKSINPPGDVGEITEYIINYLESYGVEPDIYQTEERKRNIVATYGNPESDPTLILNGHVDVVPVTEKQWSFDPFSGAVENGQLLGRGASDMKAGLAGLLYSFCKLSENSPDIDGSVILSIVPDEEALGECGTKWLIENEIIPKADACLIAEPTSGDTISIGQKGSFWLRFTSQGGGSHGSLAPYTGENAILKLSTLEDSLLELRKITGDLSAIDENTVLESREGIANATGVPASSEALDHVTVNVGTISGGTKVNVIPEYAEMEVDMRLPIGSSISEVADAVDRIVEETDGEIEYEILQQSEPNFTAHDDTIVKTLADHAENEFGLRPQPRLQWASSDARYFRQQEIPTIQYGPAEVEGIHSEDEFVTIEEVITSARVYAGTMLEFVSGDGRANKNAHPDTL